MISHVSINYLQCVAFNDINPQAPVHFLVIPRDPIPMLSKSDDTDTEVSVLDVGQYRLVGASLLICTEQVNTLTHTLTVVGTPIECCS